MWNRLAITINRDEYEVKIKDNSLINYIEQKLIEEYLYLESDIVNANNELKFTFDSETSGDVEVRVLDNEIQIVGEYSWDVVELYKKIDEWLEGLEA